jgi:hypothetical protein
MVTSVRVVSAGFLSASVGYLSIAEVAEVAAVASAAAATVAAAAAAAAAEEHRQPPQW